MSNVYKILVLEDNSDDVELMLHELNEAKLNFESRHASRKQEFLQHLAEFHPDIVLADYSLVSFNGMQAFRTARERGVQIPFILVTGVISEQMAIDFLKEGVDDFILKSSFKRLPSAIISAVSRKNTELEKRQIESQLKKSHSELKSLLSRQQAAREAERKEIAREMHDELGQILTMLKVDVVMLQKKVNGAMASEDISTEFNTIKRTIDQITQSVKRISSGLRPETIDDLGFIESIRIQCEEFERRNGIHCVAQLDGTNQIDKDFSLAIYRIVQEALTNIVRHAKATRVTIRMRQGKRTLSLEIRDNGIGITDEALTSSKSFGLIGLRERVDILNGTLRIHGRKNLGTLVSVRAPITRTNTIQNDKFNNS